MIRHTLATLALLPSLCVFSQNNGDAVREINAIKSDTTYICAESTVKDWETAYENAKLLLTREIEDWLTKKGVKDISGVIATSNEHILEIKTTRGSLYRAFVYVNKNNLLSFTDKSKVVVVDMLPIDSDSTNTVPSSDTLNSVEKEMLSIKTFSMIEPYIKAKKKKGIISRYGKYADMPETGLIYIFIYNREGLVPACLRSNGNVSVNLSNGHSESITDQYKGCGAIWFQLKEQ